MEWLMKKFRKRKVAPSSKTDVVRDVASISGSVCSMTPSQLNDVIIEMLKLNRNRCDDACRGNPITQSGKAKQMVKMIGAILVPLFALITMTTNSFIGDLTEYQQSTSVTETLEFSTELGIFLRHLQRERDMSALYVSEISPHTKNMLVRLYSDTDDALNALTKWPITEEDHMTCDMDIFRSRDRFLTALNKHRYQLDIKRQTSKEEILYYSSLITEFIEWLYKAICQGSTGRIWKILVAFQEIIMATEYIGRERAYGVSFYALGKFKTREDYLSFLEAQDVGNMTLASSREYSDMAPDALILHRNGQEDVLHHTHVMRAEIRSNRSSVPNGSLDMAKWWFDNMTIYKDTIMQCQNVLSSRLKGMIEEEANENFRKLIVTACIFGIVLVICPSIITAAYLLTSKLHQYSVSIKNRTKALNKERTRTDTLLYQMLPQALADSLRVNEHVEAKVYESSTILVGDIVGLSRVSSHCTPAEVVMLLNHLHACFDQRTRAYDVHRVETIGNVYMVVSGVLAVNRRSHAPEVCTLALDLMQRIRQLEIPHISERRLLLRIGCHSGSVVAGVVGNKVPRYCLFGDTVTVATKMETLGKADMIQLSEVTHDLLLQKGGFVTEERRDGSVKHGPDMHVSGTKPSSVILNLNNVIWPKSVNVIMSKNVPKRVAGWLGYDATEDDADLRSPFRGAIRTFWLMGKVGATKDINILDHNE